MILTLSLANRKHANKKGTPQSLEVPLVIVKTKLRYLNRPRPGNLKIKNHVASLSFNLRPSLEEEILP